MIYPSTPSLIVDITLRPENQPAAEDTKVPGMWLGRNHRDSKRFTPCPTKELKMNVSPESNIDMYVGDGPHLCGSVLNGTE